jgi:hypothetical protein
MRILSLIFFAVFFAASCDNDDSNPDPELLKIAEAFVDSAETAVVLYAEDSLAVGYNTFFIELRDADGDVVDDAHVAIAPLMQMMSTSHSCPFEIPAADGRRFRSGVVFQMASNDMERWQLDVNFHNHRNDREGSARFTLDVAPSGCVQMTTVDTTLYIVALKNPVVPRVGMNELEIGLYRRETMMNFPAVTTGVMTFEPMMPSMGHGSPGNEQPHHVENGLYVGQVNFTMTGEWQLAVQAVVGVDTVSVNYDVLVE